MTLGHVGQFDAIHCDSTTHQVLSNYILMLNFFLSFTVYGASKFTCLILYLLIFLVSGVFWVFWNLLLFLSSFSAILLRDVIGSKNERFTKRLITKACVQCAIVCMRVDCSCRMHQIEALCQISVGPTSPEQSR